MFRSPLFQNTFDDPETSGSTWWPPKKIHGCIMVYLKMDVGLLFPLNFQTTAISRSLEHVPISISQNLHKKGTVHCQGWPLTLVPFAVLLSLGLKVWSEVTSPISFCAFLRLAASTSGNQLQITTTMVFERLVKLSIWCIYIIIYL